VLAADGVAPGVLAVFCVGPIETAVLILTPGTDGPHIEFAPVGEAQLKELLPATDASEAGWNADLAAAVPILSDKLMRPLTRLREAVQTCKTLYVVPDSHLYSVPFAALTLGDNVPLVEHCAVVLLPSASMLLEAHASRPRSDRTCLAVGVGESQGISFAAQARTIAEMFTGELGWTTGTLYIPEAEATVERFLAEAPRFRVLHVDCHGQVREGVMDTLSASTLRLTGGDLTAKALLKPDGSWLNADLVFLNACRSAGFRMRLPSEVGGFWQAFLEAGVPALVATLFYVDPIHAQNLAQEFYRNWLTHGMTKATALQHAQLTLARRGLEVGQWASHVLIGDPR
jgi:CHAT domain-containing protein